MSHFGTAMSWLFKPITVPLVWLFKHRCSFEPGTDHCRGLFCPVGKEGVEGWTNMNRGGEWSRIPKRPATLPKAPPPPTFPRGRLTRDIVSRLTTEEINNLMAEAYRRTVRKETVSDAQIKEYHRRVAVARQNEDDGYYIAPSHSWAFVPPPPELPTPPEPMVSCTCFSSNCKHTSDPNHVSNRLRIP